MTKFLLAIIGLSALTFFIIKDTCFVTLSTPSYEITVSSILFLVALLVVLWVLKLLAKPFGWWGKFQTWRQTRKQVQKSVFLPELLTVLVAHETDKKEKLVAKASKLYGANATETLLISALLTPKAQTFETLSQTESTKMAGLYGLVQQAQDLGDFEAIDSLLRQVPVKYETTPWVQQTKMSLALIRNDWSGALKLLETNKKQYTKEQYLSHKAALMLKMGQVDKAFAIAPTQPAIALAYAEVFPKKAIKALEKAWRKNPNWLIYLGYKKAIQALPEKKRMKAILDLTRSTRDQRYSLLARADMDMDLHNWMRAKENLDIYLQQYPLTRQVADMMAFIERTGWHHEAKAIEWEQKAIESEDDSLWMCASCNHTVGEWHILCPHCNAFDSLYNK